MKNFLWLLFLIPTLVFAEPSNPGYDQGSRGNGGGSGSGTVSSGTINHFAGYNSAGTTVATVANISYDSSGNVTANSFITAATNVPQTDFFPALAGDTHWIWGLNGDGDGTNNDHLVLSEGTTLGSSNRIDCAPGGNCVFSGNLGNNGFFNYSADAQANDTYVVTNSPAWTAYTTGACLRFKANTANTGAATLNVNGLGATAIKKNKSAALADNDILAGQIVDVCYDGTNFEMQSQLANAGSGTVTSVGVGSTGSTITVTSSPVTTSGTINVELNVGHANTWTADQTISAHNIPTDTTTGMDLWTSSSQKGGFYGATPIVRPTGNICTAMQNLGLISSCTESGTSQWTTTGNDIYYNTGAVLVGGTSATNYAESAKSIVSLGADADRFISVNTAAYGSSSGGGYDAVADAGSAVTSGARIGRYTFQGAPDANHITNLDTAASIEGYAEENFSTSALGSQIRFRTTPKTTANRVTHMIITGNGNIESSGTIPTVSSCGTSPSVTSLSTNNSGSVQVGSVSATSCIITFANSGWVNAPNCVASDDTSIVAVKAVTTTTTLTLSSTVLTSDKVSWICQGNE